MEQMMKIRMEALHSNFTDKVETIYLQKYCEKYSKEGIF